MVQTHLRRQILVVVALAAASSGVAADRPAETLPTFSVRPEFTLRVSPPPHTDDNKLTLITVDDAPPARWHGFVRFRSASVKSGDRVVSIEGKPVAQMKPGEARRFFHLLAPGKKLALEVQQPKEKTIRQAIVTRVAASEPDEQK